VVDVELVGSALADPSLGIIRESQVAILDITGRKKAESWFRRVVETTQDAVVSIDRQGRIVMFNASAERIFSYRGNEIAGQKVNVLMPEPYMSQHDEYIARYERTGEAHAIGQIRTVTARRKNGLLFPIELSITQIPDENAPYAAFIRDISDKTRLQKQLVESERLAAIGTTAAIMGHEIANPLNTMYLSVQLLEQQLAQQETALDEQIAAELKTIKSETARLTKLLQQFRIMSRKEQYDFCPTNIAELIIDAAKSYRPVWAHRKIEIEYVLEPTLPSVIVDRDKITQVLLNLYKNSVEAMPSGGKITVKTSATEAGVVLEITDTGTGIPADIDIFEPFATTKIGGTGIGLMVVRQIVMAHGGSITYQSEPGKGTSFFITLPVKV
jgi:PAS domain S-box-containing protein